MLQDSVIAGVKFHIANPEASPGASHRAWLVYKTAEGWKYGPKKIVELKEHPCMLPFDQLPQDQQVKDYLFTAVVRTLLPQPPK